MNKINFLKHLFYHPFISRVARTFHLQSILKKWYFSLARPADGILRLKVGGINAKFYARTPGEMRLLEPSILKEKHSLERLLSILRPGDVVYDIGAQVGLYAVPLAKAVGEQGQVIAFEPESQSFTRLQDNLRLNSLSNVRSFRKALGECNEERKLYAGEDGRWCSLINPPTDMKIGYQKVEVIRGDQFQEDENLPLPRIVKVDVEGYEYAVLQGLRATLSQPTCELVCVETHPALLPSGVKPEMILELLKSLGFSRVSVHPYRNTYHVFASKVKND